MSRDPGELWLCEEAGRERLRKSGPGRGAAFARVRSGATSGRDALEIQYGCESDRSESECVIWAKSHNLTTQSVSLVVSLCTP